MVRPDPSGSNCPQATGITKSRQQSQQAACDRCRGQKLRCIRSEKHHPKCERCHKAGATCVVDSSVRMGRPQRRDAHQRTSKTNINTSTKSSDTIHVQDMPPIQGRPAFSSKNMETAEQMWVDYELDEAIDPDQANAAQYTDFLNFGHPNSTSDEDERMHMSLFLGAAFHDTFDSDSSHVPRNLPDFSMAELGSSAEGSLLQQSSFEPTEATIISNIITNQQLDKSQEEYSSVSQRKFVERVSNLNVELYRQLSIVRRMTMQKEWRSSEQELGKSPSETSTDNDNLRVAIVSMLQGLQAFQELLVDILSSTASPVNSSRSTPSPPQNALWHSTSPSLVNLLSLTITSTKDGSQGGSASGVNNKQPGADTSSNKPRPLQSDSDQLTGLDISTSLLIISCYINLIRVCRDVFAAIGDALFVPGQHIKLPILSGLQNCGVPIHQDSDLQIIVLIQLVVRLVDRIGTSLVQQKNCYSLAEGNAESYGKGMPPQLLDFVLGHEGLGEQSAYRAMDALRGQIRRLNALVYKLV